MVTYLIFGCACIASGFVGGGLLALTHSAASMSWSQAVARGKGSIEAMELIWPGGSLRVNDRINMFEVDGPVSAVITIVRREDAPWILREVASMP